MTIKEYLSTDVEKSEHFLIAALLFVSICLIGAGIILAAMLETVNALAFLDVPYIMLGIMAVALMASVIYYLISVYLFDRKLKSMESMR